MIITCPECATRYDIDDERFSPAGRSVRCTACGESWFVPAPEPIEDLAPAARIIEPDREAKPKRRGAPLKARSDDEYDERPRRKAAGGTSWAGGAGGRDDFGDDDDDSLFDAPDVVRSRLDKAGKPTRSARGEDDEAPSRGWRKGRRSDLRDEEAPEAFEEEDARSGFDARGARQRAQALRFADEAGPCAERADDDADYDEDLDYDAEGDATIVDADWEDVDDRGGRQRGFGRRVRAERRRAAALARVEDVRRFDPEMFDEQFFASLRVTPRELERAVRKARRRAEMREKNRLTPLRAFGWSAWIAAVAGAIYGLVVYRDEIVKIAPSAADAYAVVGIAANPYGLKIDDVRHRLAMSTTGPTIEITGALRNAGAEAVDAPLLQAEALGARGELLSRWTFAPGETRVEGGGVVEFMTRAPAPEGVVEVALSFAPDKSAARELLRRGE